VYDVVFSDAFQLKLTASTSRHSELFAGELSIALVGVGVGGGSTGPPPPLSSPPPPEQAINKTLNINIGINKLLFIIL
jgi:hypothetical protein